MDVLSVKCPYCKAEKGKPCMTKWWDLATRPHKQRLKVASILQALDDMEARMKADEERKKRWE